MTADTAKTLPPAEGCFQCRKPRSRFGQVHFGRHHPNLAFPEDVAVGEQFRLDSVRIGHRIRPIHRCHVDQMQKQPRP